ncbi:MAG: hypothetical protein PUP93_29015 [Rhizonema sp. NSF051]|nr:hypothetical protein [Rhizonema sp. NSF051]
MTITNFSSVIDAATSEIDSEIDELLELYASGTKPEFQVQLRSELEKMKVEILPKLIAFIKENDFPNASREMDFVIRRMQIHAVAMITDTPEYKEYIASKS